MSTLWHQLDNARWGNLSKFKMGHSYTNIKYKPLLESSAVTENIFKWESEGKLFSILQLYFMIFACNGNQKQNNSNEEFLPKRWKAATAPSLWQNKRKCHCPHLAFPDRKTEHNLTQVRYSNLSSAFLVPGVCLFHSIWILPFYIKTAFLLSAYKRCHFRVF